MFRYHQRFWVITQVSSLSLATLVLAQCSMKTDAIALPVSNLSLPAASLNLDTPKTSTDMIADRSQTAAGAAFHTATASLDDVGLREDEIDKVLQAAADHPYAHPAKLTCMAIVGEIAQLDAALGPDVDAPSNDLKDAGGIAVDSDTILDRGMDFAQESAVNFVRAQTSFLPFRSAIRTFSGAKHHEKEIARAKEAGRLRRAYLKGLLDDKGKCSAPSAPAAPHIEEASFSLFD